MFFWGGSLPLRVYRLVQSAVMVSLGGSFAYAFFVKRRFGLRRYAATPSCRWRKGIFCAKRNERKSSKGEKRKRRIL